MTSPELSVVVPMYDEFENVGPLVEAVRTALGDRRWELVLVNDGSRDGTGERMREEASRDRRIRVVELARNYGQTVAMQAGFDFAAADVVVSMDGDLQNDPLDIPPLLTRLEEGYDLVVGYRVARQDRFLTRRLPSWVANRLIRGVTGVPIKDNGCSLKAFRRDVLQRIRLYSDLHRFIPALAASTAGARIAEIPVRHHTRQHGVSKYGLSRVLKVLGDLLAIMMIRLFRERPLVMFGTAAVLMTALGVALGIAGLWVQSAARDVGSFVFPSAGLLCFGLAGFLFILGLLAEQILRVQLPRAAGAYPILHERELS